MIECPLCGYELDKRGLGSHKNSRRCIARQTRQEYEEKGFVIVPSRKLANFLKERGVDIEHDKTGYIRGNIHRRSTYSYGVYAPKEDVEKAREELVLHPNEKPRYEKLSCDGEYVLAKYPESVLANSPSDTLLIFRLNEKDTRKWKFLVSDENVFTVQGKKIGEVVKNPPEKVVPKLKSKAVMDNL